MVFIVANSTNLFNEYEQHSTKKTPYKAIQIAIQVIKSRTQRKLSSCMMIFKE